MQPDSILPDTDGPSRRTLVDLLVDTLRIARERGEECDHLRRMYSFAADTATELGEELDQLRTQNDHLRVQLRAAVSGRTVAAERQDLEREAIEPGYRHVA